MRNRLKSKLVAPRNQFLTNRDGGGSSVNIGETNSASDISVNTLKCNYVSLVNLDLTGAETIDGASPSNDDTILVANQTDASENGIYIYDDSGAWERLTGLQAGQQITITGGTKQGTDWVVETPVFEEGVDDISIVEHAISRKDNSFAGFPAVTSLLTSDIALFQTSDDVIRQGTVNDILDLVVSGSEIDNTGDTFFVSPNYTDGGIYYNDLQDAIDASDADTNIIVFAGTYTGNYDLDTGCKFHFMNGAVLTPSTATSPALYITDQCTITGGLVIDYTPSGCYAIETTTGSLDIQALSICPSLGMNAIKIIAPTIGNTFINVQYLGGINFSGSVSARVNSQQIDNIVWGGANQLYLNAQLVTGQIDVTAGKAVIVAEEYIRVLTYVAKVLGGTLVLSGRITEFANGTDNNTGNGYPLQVVAGMLHLRDVQCKNALGGNLWFGGGEGRLQNVTFESGGGGGGGVACIDSPPGGAGTVRFIGSTTLRVNVGNIGSELITANKTVDMNTRV